MRTRSKSVLQLSPEALSVAIGGIAVHRPSDLVQAGELPDFIVVETVAQPLSMREPNSISPFLAVYRPSAVGSQTAGQSPLSLIQGMLGSLGSLGGNRAAQPNRIVGSSPEPQQQQQPTSFLGEGDPQGGLSFTFDQNTPSFAVVDQHAPNLSMNNPSFGNFALDSFNLGAANGPSLQPAAGVATQGIADEAGFAEMPIDNSTSADGTAF